MSLPSNSLYLRNHALYLAVVPPVGGKESSNYSAVGYGKELKNRIAFTCEKTTLPEVNKSRIQVYNPSFVTKHFIDNNNLVVMLKAGYGVPAPGQAQLLSQTRTVFIGDVLRREFEKQGSDTVLTLELGDSEKAFSRNAMQVSLKGQTGTQAILNQAISAMGVGVKSIEGFVNTSLSNGFSYSGSAAGLISKLTKALRLDFYLDDGLLTIKPYGFASHKRMIVVNEKTGLVGVPTKTQIGVSFTTLLDGRMRPGQLVKLESNIFSGQTGLNANLTASAANIKSGDIVTVITVAHEGDSYGNTWHSKVDAVKVATPKEKVEGVVNVESL